MKRLLSAACAAALFAGLSVTAAPVLAYSGEVYTVCRLDPSGDNYLSLRTCRSSRCPEIRRLRPGQFLWTEEPFPQKGWRAVLLMRDINDEYALNQPRGYVFEKYICYVDMTQ